MSYLVLARKWRSNTFDEVVGQGHVTRTLKNAIELDRVAHALLFTGSRGVGKTSCARILAKALNCETGPTVNPCGTCAACAEITTGTSVDVFEIDGASNNSVEQIREIRESVKFLPTRGKRKVYIIDEVHMLSTSAFNALLKTLEEPPGHVLFVFATTEPHKIPDTIISRCQRYDFKRIPERDIVEHLGRIASAEGIQVESAALHHIAREARGGMRDSLSLLDQVIAFCGNEISEAQTREVLGIADRQVLHHLTGAVFRGDGQTALEIVDQLFRFGLDLQKFAAEFVQHLRDLMVVKVCADPARLVDVAEEEVAAMISLVETVDPARIHRVFNALLQGADEVARSPFPKLVLEMTLLRLCHQGATLPLSKVLDGLARLESRLGGPAPTGGGSPSGGGGPPGGGMSGPPTGGQGPSGGQRAGGFGAAPPTGGFAAAPPTGGFAAAPPTGQGFRGRGPGPNPGPPGPHGSSGPGAAPRMPATPPPSPIATRPAAPGSGASMGRPAGGMSGGQSPQAARPATRPSGGTGVSPSPQAARPASQPTPPRKPKPAPERRGDERKTFKRRSADDGDVDDFTGPPPEPLPASQLPRLAIKPRQPGVIPPPIEPATPPDDDGGASPPPSMGGGGRAGDPSGQQASHAAPPADVIDPVEDEPLVDIVRPDDGPFEAFVGLIEQLKRQNGLTGGRVEHEAFLIEFTGDRLSVAVHEDELEALGPDLDRFARLLRRAVGPDTELDVRACRRGDTLLDPERNAFRHRAALEAAEQEARCAAARRDPSIMWLVENFAAEVVEIHPN